MKLYCPFLGLEVDATDTSIEHIIPASLGGSDQFVIQGVSKKGNNDLGSLVDGKFINDPFVSMQLHSLDITNRNGQPHILKWPNGEIEINGQKQKISLIHSKDDNWSYHFKDRKVEYIDEKTKKKYIKFITKPEEASEIIDKMKERYGKKDFKIDFNQSEEQKIENPSVGISFKIDFNIYAKQFVKIALGSAIYNTNRKFLKTKDSERLRKILWETDNSSADLQLIRERISLDASDDKTFNTIKRDNNHIITFYYLNNKCVCLILLFGVWSGMIMVTDDNELSDLFEYEVFYSIDPFTGQFTKSTFIEFMSPMVKKIIQKN